MVLVPDQSVSELTESNIENTNLEYKKSEINLSNPKTGNFNNTDKISVRGSDTSQMDKLKNVASEDCSLLLPNINKKQNKSIV